MVYAAVLAVLWFVLPADGVVLHSGPSGPDRWGSRVEFVAVMAAVGAGITLLFDLIGTFLISRVDLSSAVVNLPHKAWWTATAERTARARHMMMTDFYGLGAATMVFMALMAALVQVSASWLPLTATGAAVVLVLGWCVHLMTRRYRPAGTE